MIALVPSPADLERLPLDGSEPRDDLHLTLAFLGEAANWTPGDRGALLQGLANLPALAVLGEGFGANYWNPDSDSPSWNLAVGGTELEVVHGAVWELLYNAVNDMAAPEIPEQHAPWAPHICLAYSDDTTLAEAVAERAGPIAFDRLRVAFGADVTDLPLGAVTLPEQAFESEEGTVTADASQPVEHFHYRMAEGVSTGLRTFASGAITWRQPPFAFMWQKMIPESGGHGLAVQTGLITRAERSGELVDFYGPLDLNSEDGLEYARRLVEGFARWGSVSPDENKVDVEVVWADGTSEEDMLVGGEPEQYVFHSFNVAELTALSVPALADATIEPTPALYEELARRGALPKGVEVPRPQEAVAAAAVADLDTHRPPADWFANPTLSEPTGIVVTDDGQVYGHAATFDSCHIGFQDQCVAPPHESDHPYFLTGEVLCADGSRVPVGQVTLGTGHAPLSHGATKAAEHYDHTGSVVADVTCGNDEHGIWVAGAVRPGVEPARVHELRASGQLSGDWRRIGGQLRLVALLAVNVPGFPVPRPRARVASGDPMALVAAGKVAHEAGQGGPDLSRVKELLAASMGRDRVSRLAEARERVEAGR